MFAFMGIKMLQKWDRLYYILSSNHCRIYFYKNWHCVFFPGFFPVSDHNIGFRPTQGYHRASLSFAWQWPRRLHTTQCLFCHCTDSLQWNTMQNTMSGQPCKHEKVKEGKKCMGQIHEYPSSLAQCRSAHRQVEPDGGGRWRDSWMIQADKSGISQGLSHEGHVIK